MLSRQQANMCTQSSCVSTYDAIIEPSEAWLLRSCADRWRQLWHTHPQTETQHEGSQAWKAELQTAL